MAFRLGEPTVQQYFDANGDPLANGTIEFFLTGTSTPTPIYSDSAGTSAGTSVSLNTIGAPENGGVAIGLYFDDSITYKIVRKDAAGTVIDPTIDPYRVDYLQADLATDDDTAKGADLVGYRGRTVHDYLDDVANVKNFGAVGDGTTDDTAAIQAAIDFIETSALGLGGTVFFPHGSYLVSAPLVCDHDWVAFKGDAHNSSRIIRASGFTTGHTISFSKGGGVNSVFYGLIENLQLISTDAMTSGSHIHLDVCRNFIIRDCLLREGYIGLHAVSVGELVCDNLRIKTGNLYPTGISEAFAYVYLDTDITATIPRNGAQFIACNFRSEDDTDPHCQHGVRISSADGIWFTQCHIGNTSVSSAYHFPKDTTTQLTGVTYEHCWLDRCTGTGIQFDGQTTAAYYYFGIYDCFFTGAEEGTTAIRAQIDSGVVSNIQISGCLITNWKGHGILMDTATNWSISDSMIRNVSSDGGSHGIFTTSNCFNYRIQGVSSGFHVDGTSTSTTGYGIVADGAGYIITGNDLRGNTTGGITDNGVTNVGIIKDNIVKDTGLQSVASAATITPPVSGDVFNVTGTTTITSIAASWVEREIKLHFLDALTVTDGSNLVLSGNFVTTANDTLTLISDGTNWIETGRSVN